MRLRLLAFVATTGMLSAADLSHGIELYRHGSYAASSTELSAVVESEPNNPVALDLRKKRRIYFRSDERIVSAGTERVLLFIHGYNNSFEDAVKRAAQIAAAADYSGYIYVFSWPSQSRYSGYAADMDYAEQAELYLQYFIKQIFAEPTGLEVDIIAHSMGAQILMRSMSALRAASITTCTPPARRVTSGSA